VTDNIVLRAYKTQSVQDPLLISSVTRNLLTNTSWSDFFHKHT